MIYDDLGNTSTNKTFPMGSLSSQYLIPGDYLKLKNIVLGYTMPHSLLSKTKIISSLRIYFTANNVLTFAKNNVGGDPEFDYYGNSNLGGIQRSSMPTIRSYSFGLDVKF
jgi:hypothetical protein